MTTGNSDFDTEVEDKFKQWCEHCDARGKKSFADILRLTGSLQQDDSGEGIIVFQNAPRPKQWTRIRPEPRLRLMVVEPDRLQNPLGLFTTGSFDNDKIRDGIEFDEDGQPLFYYILKKHPGSTSTVGLDVTGRYDRVPAAQVVHMFREDRPGQSRGYPRIAPGLPLLAHLRRFTLATVQAAETAANISGTIEGDLIGDEEDELEAGDEIEIPRNSWLTIPRGMKMNQVKPEQPAPTYKEFRDAIINEYARCLVMPFNVAAGNSAGYNYASGRLDKQEWFKFMKTERRWIETQAISRIFTAWLKEAMLIPGYFKNSPGRNVQITPRWFWPGQEHVDPVKEAVAQDKRLKNHTTNLSIEYALQGKDWEREIRQAAKERKLLEELDMLYEFDPKIPALEKEKGNKDGKTKKGKE